MNKNTMTVAVIALIIGGGIGYVAHAPAPVAQNVAGNFSGRGGMMSVGGGRGGANGGGFLSGTVAKQDSGSLTVNTRDGSSHIVLITPATTVSKSVKGALTDVATGSNIIVSGTTNSDGSVSATLIQLRPATTTGVQN